LSISRSQKIDRGSEGKSRRESSRLWKSRWEAFDALCHHEYWTRTWIIQEVLLAKTVVLCGNEMMQPWSSFEALCRALDERPRPPLGHSQAEGAVESIPLQLVNDRIHLSVSSNRQLRRLLEAYSSSRSTITHDKIYGLLGLAEKSSDIQVDYSKDCLDLYLDTLGFCRYRLDCISTHNRQLALPGPRTRGLVGVDVRQARISSHITTHFDAFFLFLGAISSSLFVLHPTSTAKYRRLSRPSRSQR
jgi:hypothetical protein